MEQDLSFILLVFAGFILLILFIYSLKTRVRPGRRIKLDHEVLDPMGQDENDILSMPLNSQAQEPFIEPNLIKSDSSVTDEIIEEPAAEVEPSVTEERVTTEIEAEPEFESEPESSPVAEVHSKLIVLNVLPQEGRKFIGYELLQALLGANLRHGAMSIFHRHETAMGEGNVLFSVAQVTEPGTFSLDAMGACQCSGLTMFMQLTGPEHNLKAYEMFIQAAQQIADSLRGVLVDQKREALTADSTKRFKAQVQAHLQSLGKSI